jgi:S-DNA-T family DNA segregation ATPase FtsK/SpoIIIE
MLLGLYLKDPSAQFILIDLKGGLEASLFEELQRVIIAHELPPSVLELSKLEKIIRQRMAHYKSEHCKDIGEFRKKVLCDDLVQKDFDRKLMLSRYYIVIDEAAEMFLAGQGRNSESVEIARKVVSLIARQGRSVGVHLVIATQRPDSKALDPQVKANLTGVLCFPIANDASSITVLGNGRATDLPDIKGRAIWKNGMELVEVQTPYLSPEDFKKLVKDERKYDQPPRPQDPPRSLEVEASSHKGPLDPSWAENNDREPLCETETP